MKISKHCLPSVVVVELPPACFHSFWLLANQTIPGQEDKNLNLKIFLSSVRLNELVTLLASLSVWPRFRSFCCQLKLDFYHLSFINDRTAHFFVKTFGFCQQQSWSSWKGSLEIVHVVKAWIKLQMELKVCGLDPVVFVLTVQEDARRIR